MTIPKSTIIPMNRLKENFVHICFNCTRSIDPDENDIKTYFKLTPERTATQCHICNRWTLEGIYVDYGYAKINFVGIKPKEDA